MLYHAVRNGCFLTAFVTLYAVFSLIYSNIILFTAFVSAQMFPLWAKPPTNSVTSLLDRMLLFGVTVLVSAMLGILATIALFKLPQQQFGYGKALLSKDW